MSTANVDRSIKMRAYRQLPSLAAYVWWRKRIARSRSTRPATTSAGHSSHIWPGEIVQLPGIDFDMALDDVYADTDTPEVQLVSDQR